MANKKQFFRDINPGDVSIEGRQSNGITARADGSVILYSGVKDNELDSLQNYNGNIPVDGYLGNIIAVLKADQNVAFPIGNDNEETYIESTQIDPNKIITTTNTTTDCNDEFDDIATLLLTEINKVYRDFGFRKSKPKNLDQAKKLLLDYFYNNVLSTALGKEVLSLAQSHPDKLIPKNLPPGLRSFYLYHSFINEAALTRHLLLAVGKDFLNITNNDINSFGDSIGLPTYQQTSFYDNEKKQKISDINGNLTNELVYKQDAPNIPSGAKIYAKSNDVVDIYTTNFPKIIEAYNKDKSIFLGALKSVFIRQINEIINKDKIYYKKDPNGLKNQINDTNFKLKLIESVYNIALKYINCPPPTTTPITPTASTPNTSTTPPTSALPTKQSTPPQPALEYLPEDELGFIQSSSQVFEDIDYYRTVEIIDGSLWIATTGYSAQVQALYNAEKSGVSTKTKSGKEVIIAAKSMIDKAIAQYPMIADKSKYPDAMNRLLAMCLVAYTETRFTPQPENPNYTFNTAQRAKVVRKGFNTLDTFYAKFGVKPGDEGKRASGDAKTANPENIFSAAYGNTNGNGPESSGDGYKYRGRGYYGITFKNGYRNAGKQLYGDENKFLNDPDLVNTEPIATEMFLKAMWEGGLCALDVGLLAYTNTPGKVGKYNVGSIVSVTLPNGTVKKIRGDVASNYTTSKGANNLVNGNTAQGYVDNFGNIYNSQELRDYINSKLK